MDLQKQAALNSMHGSLSGSGLCTLILDFWSLVLQQESWALTQDPGPLGTTGMVSPVSSHADWENDEDMNCDEIIGTEMVSQNNLTNTTEPAQDQVHRVKASWNMARFLLNEERDRLCLWQFGFSDGDLDRLVSNADGKAGTPANIFGSAVIESLVRIGDALLTQTGRSSVHI